MQLAPALRETLPRIAAALADAADDWWIIGSAAVALHGAGPDTVRDVDVLLGVADARRILPRLGLAPAAGTGDGLFRSDIFARWDAPPLTVEYMAGFHLFREGRWTPVTPRSRQAIAVDGATLFVPTRPDLIAMLEMFGRPKDAERARLLAAAG